MDGGKRMDQLKMFRFNIIDGNVVSIGYVVAKDRRDAENIISAREKRCFNFHEIDVQFDLVQIMRALNGSGEVVDDPQAELIGSLIMQAFPSVKIV